MEGDLSTTDQQSMVSSFLEIAVGQTADTARQFLQVHPFISRRVYMQFLVCNC